MPRIKGSIQNKTGSKSQDKPPAGLPAALAPFPDLDNLNMTRLIPVALAQDKTVCGGSFLWTDAPERVRAGKAVLSSLASRQFQAVYNMCQLLQGLQNRKTAVMTFRGQAQGLPPKHVPGFAKNSVCGFVEVAVTMLESGVVEVMVYMLALTVNTFITNIILKGLSCVLQVEEVCVRTLAGQPWLPQLLLRLAHDHSRDVPAVRRPALQLLLQLVMVMKGKDLRCHVSALTEEGDAITTVVNELTYLAQQERKVLRSVSREDLSYLVRCLNQAAVLMGGSDSLNQQLIKELVERHSPIGDGLTPNTMSLAPSALAHCYYPACRAILGADDVFTACRSCKVALYCVKDGHPRQCEECPDLKILDPELWKVPQEQCVGKSRKAEMLSASENYEVPADTDLSICQKKFLETKTSPDKFTSEQKQPRLKRPLELGPLALRRMVYAEIKQALQYHPNPDIRMGAKWNESWIEVWVERQMRYTIDMHVAGECKCGNPILHCFPQLTQRRRPSSGQMLAKVGGYVTVMVLYYLVMDLIGCPAYVATLFYCLYKMIFC